MGLSTALAAQREDGREGVSLAQLAELVERAIQESQNRGVSTGEVFPKVTITMSGKIRKIELSV